MHHKKQTQKSFLCAAVCFLVIFFPTIETASQETVNAPFAVVELFTSEGCSSCPPADQLLTSLNQLAEQQGRRIFTLGFHVDYWNYLGWEDRFSQSDFSQRQRQYAKKLRLNSVYTPQMIVNGQKAFGGYRKDLAQEQIDKALKIPQQVAVTLKVGQVLQNELTLSYKASRSSVDEVLNIALVQQNLSSHVTGGENAGRTLSHNNVVRAFKTIALHKDAAGSLSLELPADVDPAQISVIGYIQNKQSMAILGADQIFL